MAAWSRWLPAGCRRLLPGVVCGAGGLTALWWAVSGSADESVLVLGWSLGLLPVHVTLRGPWTGGGRVVRRPGHRRVRGTGPRPSGDVEESRRRSGRTGRRDGERPAS